MKKGFTLIEMLGIITILGVLLLLTFPVLNTSLKKMKISTADNFKNNLKVSAEAYIELNRENYPNLNIPGNSVEISIQSLYDANLLKGEYNDVDTNSLITVVTNNDYTLDYYYNGEKIGIYKDNNIEDQALTMEIALIKSKISASTKNGIYYYNSAGNLEKDSEIIYLNHAWAQPMGNILIYNNQLISACLLYNGENYDYYKGTITKQTYPCSTIRGENLVINGDLSYHNNTNYSGGTYNSAGYITTKTSARTLINTNTYIPVDLDKAYEFGTTIRSSDQTATNYLGFLPYDIDKNLIATPNIMYINNTLTTLAQDLKNGDEYIYLTDLSNWNKTTMQTYQQGFIFWNYNDSTGYQYPELTYSRNIWSSLYTNANIDAANNRIKLTKPWSNGTFKAGTKLSQSNSGGQYNYNLMNGITTPNEFKKYTSTVSGMGTASTKFRYGTAYIEWFVWGNYNTKPNVTTDFKDIYIKEVVN